jgi:hypothetical protein
MPARPPTLPQRDKRLLRRLRSFSLKSNNYNNLGKLLSLKRANPEAGREGVLTQFWHRKKRRRASSGQPSFNGRRADSVGNGPARALGRALPTECGHGSTVANARDLAAVTDRNNRNDRRDAPNWLVWRGSRPGGPPAGSDDGGAYRAPEFPEVLRCIAGKTRYPYKLISSLKPAAASTTCPKSPWRSRLQGS